MIVQICLKFVGSFLMNKNMYQQSGFEEFFKQQSFYQKGVDFLIKDFYNTHYTLL